MANQLRLQDAQQGSWGSVLDEASDNEDVQVQQREARIAESRSGLERHFDSTFVTRLALREKQIQQNYRPIIGIHKWFARHPGSVFRSLLLAEYNKWVWKLSADPLSMRRRGSPGIA